MIDDALLERLRETVGPDVAFAEAPVRLGGGFYTDNYAFRISGGPTGWDGSLVLRLFPASAPPGLATREAVVQEVADLSAVPYYEALRCAVELTSVVSYRHAVSSGHPDQEKRPTWDWIADDMLEFFRERTGVTMTLPAGAHPT